MTVNSMLTIQRNTERAKEYAKKNVGYAETDHGGIAAFSLGWTESSFARVLNEIERKYGEDALLKILDNANVHPVFSSTV